MRLFETPGLVESSSPKFNLFSDIEEHSEEEETTETMMERMEQYMSKTRGNYGSGVPRPKIGDKTHFELKGQFLKELCENTFSGSKHEDANEHIERVLEIVDLFHIPGVTQDQIMLRSFPMSLIGAASRWLRNEPSARAGRKPFRAWERFKELLMKCPQHYLTDMQEVILFYNGLDVPTRNILDSKVSILTKTTADAKVAIQEMVGCELCKGPHYTKDCPLKEEGKTLEEAYYIQFGTPYQPGRQYRVAGLGFYQRNNRNSSYPDRRQTLEESLTKFMAESAKRHEENSNKSNNVFSETVSFPGRQNGYCCDWKEAREVKILKTYDTTFPQKEKDPGSFTLPCFIHNVCFDKALVDLVASVSVMPFFTYINLGLGFSIIDDMDITSGVVLGMPFCKKFVSCQKIMERFAHGDECERMDDE
ncbi:hypothetical protein Tco_1400792 [Tanacetum coccineum]